MVNRNRLTHLIAILEKVQPSWLDMSNWFSGEHACGTVACVVGHACLDPVFREQGLDLFLGGPMFEAAIGWYAAETFFGLDEHGALHLFDPEFYPGPVVPADVITRIRTLLAESPA